MASSSEKNKSRTRDKQRKSIIETLYVKLLREPSTNMIITIVAFVFIVWMVIPLISVLSGAIYFDDEWSGGAIGRVFTDEDLFNFRGDPSTQFFSRGTRQEGGPAEAIAVYNNLAFIAERSHGIEVLDVSNSTEITEITFYEDVVSSFSDLVIQDDLLYAAGGLSGLVIFNLTEIDDGFIPITFLPFLAESTNFITVENDLAFLGVNGDNFTIIDISDPHELNILANVTVGVGANLKNIVVNNNYAYVISRTAGVVIYDITNPAAPILEEQYTDYSGIGALTAEDIVFDGETAYLALDSKGLASFNISSIANITLIDRVTDITVKQVKFSGSNAYVRIFDDLDFDYGIKIIDASDPANMTIISELNSFPAKTNFPPVIIGTYKLNSPSGLV